MTNTRKYGDIKENLQGYDRLNYADAIFFLIMSFFVGMFVIVIYSNSSPTYPITFENYQHHTSTVKGIEIEIVSKALEHNVDPIVALRIAKCESHYGKYPKNFEGSSAVGIYQFMPKTFGYCQGDINNNSDQIKCFMELYPKHKNWWLCQ